MTNPTFGEKEANVEYVTRYGVYAVIPDEKKEKIILIFKNICIHLQQETLYPKKV